MEQAGLAILVPVFNEEKALNEFLPKLIAELANFPKNFNREIAEAHIVVVDDGSRVAVKIATSNFYSLFPCFVHVLRHPVNLGQGAALQTALEYSRSISGVSLFATMDSDGQHCEADLVPMIRCLYEGKLDIVFGNRFSANRAAGMPRSRRVILRCAAQFERILTGLDLGDAHNGFRVLNRFAAEQIELRQNRMAHATQFKQLVRKYRLKYGEVPVTIRYNTETLTKGQKNSGAFIILKDLVQAYLFDR